MPINNDSLNKKLYDLLKVQGYDPIPKDSEGETTPVPNEADVFKFTFKIDGKPIGPAWITVDSGQQLRIYYDNEVMDGLSEDDESSYQSFTDFLKMLKSWAQRRQLGFDTENQDRLAGDMAQRTHMKRKEQIREGYYPMGKSASYNDNVPTIKIILQHTRQIQEGEQRYRNVAKIFLENTQGERILAPTNKPGIAQIYARHLAEGGVPNDDRWNHIKSLCEEYTKMAGFVRAVRGNQFNESAQRLVEAGLNHYQSLRESLGKMRGHRGYTAYFESWTPTLMETEGDDSTLNELFVQETLDPRIESVMPILNKLSKHLGEMKEVNELAEWADNLLEGGDGGEASEETDGDTSNTAGEGGAEDNPLDEATGAETLAHNQKTEKSRLDAFDLDEADDAEAAHKKSQVPAYMRKASGDPDWKTTTKDLEKAKERNISGKEGLAALSKKLGQLEEEGVAEALDPEKRARLDDLIDQYRTATEPNDYYDRGDYEPEEVIDMIRQEFGDKIAGEVEAGQDKMHFPRHGIQRSDPMDWKKHRPQNRITKGGKLFKQDSDYLKNTIKSRYKLSGKSATEGVAEASPEATFNALKGLKSWQVVIMNNYYRGKYPDYSGRYYYVLATSPEEAEQVVLDNADAILQELLSLKSHNGRKILPRNSAVPITADRIGKIRDGTEHGRMGTAGFKKMFGPHGPMMVKLSNGAVADIQGREQGVAEDLDANQKRVGQLGPTEKVKNNNIGKLVGANESIEHDPLDDLKRLLGK